MLQLPLFPFLLHFFFSKSREKSLHNIPSYSDPLKEDEKLKIFGGEGIFF
jgi:hypothetical protein